MELKKPGGKYLARLSKSLYNRTFRTLPIMDAAGVVAEVANVNLCVYDDDGACNNDGNTCADDVVTAGAVVEEAPAEVLHLQTAYQRLATRLK